MVGKAGFGRGVVGRNGRLVVERRSDKRMLDVFMKSMVRNCTGKVMVVIRELVNLWNSWFGGLLRLSLSS
jgi:hypothetical protein